MSSESTAAPWRDGAPLARAIDTDVGRQLVQVTFREAYALSDSVVHLRLADVLMIGGVYLQEIARRGAVLPATGADIVAAARQLKVTE